MTPILNHYFARINWSGAAAVNIDTLRALHLKHNCTIPFENLDVLLPREIQLDDQSLEEKLVIARRGGYCFEQNGVFERVLRGVGFNVCRLFGGGVLLNSPALPPRPHRLLLVGLE
ncbi:arylamine N-acetyltransferase, partial [Escherichia coli]|uniref:arylamine N-acetyltransferase n=1 Tax=Escherichia coli TaxID=562 RepID=UPI000B7DF0E8